MGTQQGVERLTREGNALKLIGKRGGKEQVVASGTYDPDNAVITFAFPIAAEATTSCATATTARSIRAASSPAATSTARRSHATTAGQ
jgi:hypothetical protein